MYVLNGIRLSPNKAFTHNGVQYPANWIELSTESERIGIGISFITPNSPPSYDGRFYVLSPTNQVIGKSLEDSIVMIDSVKTNVLGLKTIWKNDQNEEAYKLLSPTDWYVTRKSEIDTDIPVGITSYRTSVRNVCEQRKNALGIATNMTEFIGVTTFSGMDWPENVV